MYGADKDFASFCPLRVFKMPLPPLISVSPGGREVRSG